MSLPRLRARALSKSYPGVLALDNVSLDFHPGQVHALLGKNGAGKSTLVKILSGATAPTSGQILIDGRAARLESPADALRLGIATVHQELSIVPEMSIAENILLGRLPMRRRRFRPLIDWPAANALAEETLRAMDLRLDPRQPAGQLSIAHQQIVEIARAMSFSPKALLLDEPTSALARHESDRLFNLIRRLAAREVAILYITHRLHELREIAHLASILRDGKLVGTIPIRDATPATLAEMMFGRTLPRPAAPPSIASSAAPVLLETRDLSVTDRLHDISFKLHAGEILGIAGMLGAGRSELLLTLFGALPASSGQILVNGRPIHDASPAGMIRAGIALAPEDRKRHGLVLEMNIPDNLCLAAMDRITRHGLISKRRQQAVTAQRVSELAIAAPRLNQPVATLSGGNQQKVVIGNWLGASPRVMLFDEPTRGIDVHAKQQIFDIICRLAQGGVGILFVSSELEEVFEISHRILILREGRITGETRPHDITLDQLLDRCMEN